MIFREPQPFEYEGTDTGVVLLHAYTGSPNDMNFMGRMACMRRCSRDMVPLSQWIF